MREADEGLTEDVGQFNATYVTAAGVERRVPLVSLPEVLPELRRPVRTFPSYRGQRSFPGWYWSATQGQRIGFESWVERDHLVALGFDPTVVGIVSLPFWLSWLDENRKPRRHAPDFLVQLSTAAYWFSIRGRSS
ncbi:TnsA-like heteromeric transposase endonuclease subunit [Nocardia sp. NPDC052112]|uniref:TnsA-like heteromeric transposase endonuclease subunit n=1 Tax=Nocardia sp. NPDC052112 TaxID=3155646 RepID=UPI003437479E